MLENPDQQNGLLANHPNFACKIANRQPLVVVLS
jgi:hypothetical protein